MQHLTPRSDWKFVMKKFPWLWLLLSLIFLGYVGAGVLGMAVPQIDVPIWHMILAILALTGVLWCAFAQSRFEFSATPGTIYRSRTARLAIFLMFWGWFAAIVVHIVALGLDIPSGELAFIVELCAAGVTLTVIPLYFMRKGA